MKEKVIEAINDLRPFLMNDGGNIELVKIENNIVYVGEKPEAYGTELELTNLHFVYPVEEKSFDIDTKIRYNMEKTSVHVEINGDKAKMTFTEPVYSITSGQIAVFYDSPNLLLLV